MIKIYALIHPITYSVFYIGKTAENLKKRLCGHILSSKKLKTPTNIEIFKIICLGLKPLIKTIQSDLPNNTRHDWQYALIIEKEWIEYYINLGFKLTNIIGNPEMLKEIKSKIEKK